MWKTLGHEKSIDIISRGIDSGRLSHAYLITGVEGIGKTTLAVDIACVVTVSYTHLTLPTTPYV